MKKTLINTASIALVLAAMASGGRAAAAELQLRSRCDCRSPVVTLGELCEIAGGEQQGDDKLAALELFPAPPAGRERFLSIREIQDLLSLRGVDVSRHRFSGAGRVAVSRLQGDHLLERNGDALSSTSDSRVLSPSSQARDLGARASVPSHAVVAVRAIPRDAIISEADLALSVDVALDGETETFDNIEQVVGRQALRTIPAGKIVDRQWVQQPLLVRRGEVVTVTASTAGVRVSANARARADGGLGDLIPLESLQQRKTYYARVCGIRRAEVAMPAVQTAVRGRGPNAARVASGPMLHQPRRLTRVALERTERGSWR